MKVQTADAAGVPGRKVLLYGVIALAFIAIAILPALVYPLYATALRTLVLVLLLGLVFRTYAGALLSFTSVDPPAAFPEDPPSVSVVIPAYNEEPVLADTIEAALDVDYPSDLLEIVVCYEADSTDATGEIAERYDADYAPVKAVERDESGGGKAMAMNYALRYATGEIIACIDADHEYDPAAIRRAVRWFESDEEIWCVKGRCYGRNPTDSLWALHATVERHIAELADLFGREVFSGFTIFGGGQAFFRRELFDELGDFDEHVLVEDIDMSARIHAAGKDLQVDPEIITYEENPDTFEAWWSQRTRWARGWMQVAVRYLPSLALDRTLSGRIRADVAYTFAYALVPVVLVLAAPLLLLQIFGFEHATFLPYDVVLGVMVGLGPLIASVLVFARDRHHGHSHHRMELLAALTLWFYMFVQSAVYVSSFLDEFVFNKESVYVTTTRAEPADD